MMNKNILSNNGIDVDNSLEILGDIDTYNELLQDFLEETQDRLINIEKYKKFRDMKNYAILVHAIKGDSKYLGFTKLAELSLNHQLKSEENDYQYICDNYDELLRELNRVIKVVNNYLGQ